MHVVVGVGFIEFQVSMQAVELALRARALLSWSCFNFTLCVSFSLPYLLYCSLFFCERGVARCFPLSWLSGSRQMSVLEGETSEVLQNTAENPSEGVAMLSCCQHLRQGR